MLKPLFNKVSGLMVCNFIKKRSSGTGVGFTNSIYRKTPAMTFFLVQLQTCRFTVFQNELHHRYFSMKFRKFYRTSILQNNAARLLLIFCDIFNVLLALPVVNQFSHSMEIYEYYVSNIISIILH